MKACWEGECLWWCEPCQLYWVQGTIDEWEKEAKPDLVEALRLISGVYSEIIHEFGGEL